MYNWQFVNCLRLWTYMVCQPALKEAFKPLVYPLIQVIDSVINLIPTARFYPLRLHCIDLYIQIISATGVFIPVAPALLVNTRFAVGRGVERRRRSSWKSPRARRSPQSWSTASV